MTDSTLRLATRELPDGSQVIEAFTAKAGFVSFIQQFRLVPYEALAYPSTITVNRTEQALLVEFPSAKLGETARQWLTGDMDYRRIAMNDADLVKLALLAVPGGFSFRPI